MEEVMFVGETWYVKADKTPAIPDVLPSEHPERKEAVVVVGRNADNSRSAYAIQPFSREENGIPMWEPVMLATDERVESVLLDSFFAGQKQENLITQS